MGGFETEWERPEFDSVPTLAENAVYLLPGCDAVLLRKTLQATYRDFCRRSAALRTWRRIPLEVGETRYPVAPILSGEVDCVTQVTWARSHAPVRKWRVVCDNPPVVELPRWFARIDDGDSSTNVVWVQERENVGSVPVEVEPGQGPKPLHSAILVEAVEIPHIGEERATKTFLRRYGDALVDGALARLFSMQGKAWTDGEQARQHAVAYENAVSAARISSMQGGPGMNTGATNAIDMSGML